MQATRALREKMAQLLAADTTTLAQAADANLIKLCTNNFTPSESSVYADMEFADFDGSNPIEVELGTQPEGLDPNNADALITLSPPAGGFRWETTGVTNLPQTITGFALVNNGETTLFACDRLPTPITLTAINQVVDLGALILRQLANSLV
jgi:hypothetical protein